MSTTTTIPATRYSASPDIPTVFIAQKPPATYKDKVASPLVQYIKKRNPRLGIAKIVYLLDLQVQYATRLRDSKETIMAKPYWDVSLLGSFQWTKSYVTPELWGALEQGYQTMHSLRSIAGPDLWNHSL